VSHVHAVEELVAQTRAAAAIDLHYLALFGTLTLPDICAGLGAENGRTSGSKYKDWIRNNVPEHAEQAPMIYGLRCSLLHQGSALPDGAAYPLAFTVPQSGFAFHNLSTLFEDEQVGWLHLPSSLRRFAEG
jgi:hypothetical protein